MLLLIGVLAGCSKFSSSKEAAAYLESQFVKYGSYERGNCSYSLKDFKLEDGSARYNLERVCTYPSQEKQARSLFTYQVKLADLEPEGPNGKVDQDGEPMFFATCKQDLHCVDIIEKYENDPRGADSSVDSKYLSVMFRLSEDIPRDELQSLGKIFRRMMALEAKGK